MNTELGRKDENIVLSQLGADERFGLARHTLLHSICVSEGILFSGEQLNGASASEKSRTGAMCCNLEIKLLQIDADWFTRVSEEGTHLG